MLVFLSSAIVTVNSFRSTRSKPLESLLSGGILFSCFTAACAVVNGLCYDMTLCCATAKCCSPFTSIDSANLVSFSLPFLHVLSSQLVLVRCSPSLCSSSFLQVPLFYFLSLLLSLVSHSFLLLSSFRFLCFSISHSLSLSLNPPFPPILRYMRFSATLNYNFLPQPSHKPGRVVGPGTGSGPTLMGDDGRSSTHSTQLSSLLSRGLENECE